MADGHSRVRGMRDHSSLPDAVSSVRSRFRQYTPRSSSHKYSHKISHGSGPTDPVRQTTGRMLVEYRHTPSFILPKTDYSSYRPERQESRPPSIGRASTRDPGLDSKFNELQRRKNDAKIARASKAFAAPRAEYEDQSREQLAEKHHGWGDRPRSKERTSGRSVNWEQNLPRRYERDQNRTKETVPYKPYGRQRRSELDEDIWRRTEYQRSKAGWGATRMPAMARSIDDMERRMFQREMEENQSAIADNWRDIDALLKNAARLRRSLKDIWIRHEQQEQSHIEALQADLARLRRLDHESDRKPSDGWIRRQQRERSANEALLRNEERVRRGGHETASKSLKEEMLREQHEREDRFQTREQDRWRSLETILSSINQEVRLMRLQGSLQQMRHYSPDSSVSSESSSEASQSSKDDRYPRNDSTLFPHHLVSQRALKDFGYPYREEVSRLNTPSAQHVGFEASGIRVLIIRVVREIPS